MLMYLLLVLIRLQHCAKIVVISTVRKVYSDHLVYFSHYHRWCIFDDHRNVLPSNYSMWRSCIAWFTLFSRLNRFVQALLYKCAAVNINSFVTIVPSQSCRWFIASEKWISEPNPSFKLLVNSVKSSQRVRSSLLTWIAIKQYRSPFRWPVVKLTYFQNKKLFLVSEHPNALIEFKNTKDNIYAFTFECSIITV